MVSKAKWHGGNWQGHPGRDFTVNAKGNHQCVEVEIYKMDTANSIGDYVPGTLIACLSVEEVDKLIEQLKKIGKI